MSSAQPLLDKGDSRSCFPKFQVAKARRSSHLATVGLYGALRKAMGSESLAEPNLALGVNTWPRIPLLEAVLRGHPSGNQAFPMVPHPDPPHQGLLFPGWVAQQVLQARGRLRWWG